jgi:spore coat polysaccharide biosynthesis protein SpsF
VTGKTAIFLSVRDKATRLPGKVMRLLHDRPAIVHLIERLKLSSEADMVVMTTSVNPGDTGLADLAAANGIACFRGSEEDKLVRYADAAAHFGIDFFTVVDGDDLFADASFVDQIIRDWRTSGADFIIVDKLPVGGTAFGVAADAMRRVVDMKAENDTEVWGGYFTQTGKFNCHFLEPEHPDLVRPEYRMTLDYEEDLQFFTRIFDELYTGTPIPFIDIVRLLDRRPDIVAINRDAQAKFEAGIKKAAPVRLRSDA